MDFAEARSRMVDSQVRPNKVTDARIIAAMRTLPRERFVPAAQAATAYVDSDVPVGGGRVLMEPMVLARLIQIAAPRSGERALVVASGTGYGAAVLAACGAHVTAVEDDAAMLALAGIVLPALAPSVTQVSGPLAAGWAASAPYDLILIEGAVEEIPPALAAQLNPTGGRLVGVLRPVGRVGQGVIARPGGAALVAMPVFDCATATLPGMRARTGFVF